MMKALFATLLICCLASNIFGQTGQNISNEEALQIGLALCGFDPGPTDGIIGPKTRGALRQYQLRKGLIDSGHPDSKTITALCYDIRRMLGEEEKPKLFTGDDIRRMRRMLGEERPFSTEPVPDEPPRYTIEEIERMLAEPEVSQRPSKRYTVEELEQMLGQDEPATTRLQAQRNRNYTHEDRNRMIEKSPSPRERMDFSSIGAPFLIGDEGEYLGGLSSNRFAPNSVSNPYGRYGSKYSSNAPFAQYSGARQN